jgi:hypothetical protein
VGLGFVIDMILPYTHLSDATSIIMEAYKVVMRQIADLQTGNIAYCGLKSCLLQFHQTVVYSEGRS